MCVTACQVDYVLLRTTCFMFYYRGVDFWNLGDFLVLKRTVSCFLTSTLAEGRKLIGYTYYLAFIGLSFTSLLQFELGTFQFKDKNTICHGATNSYFQDTYI